jgi:hypothetical protein
LPNDCCSQSTKTGVEREGQIGRSVRHQLLIKSGSSRKANGRGTEIGAVKMRLRLQFPSWKETQHWLDWLCSYFSLSDANPLSLASYLPHGSRRIWRASSHRVGGCARGEGRREAGVDIILLSERRRRRQQIVTDMENGGAEGSIAKNCF